MNKFQNIPNELRELHQWVVVDGDSKVPINPSTGDAASSSTPNTWGSYEESVRLVQSGDVQNIGFVFNNNGYIGIDIDTGWDEDGLMTSQCADIIGVCQSYTEKSRSGRGFHIILKGELSFKGKNNLRGVEIYKDSRYFITTGDVFLYSDITENQEAVNYIVDKYFGETVRETRNGIVNRVYTPEWELPENGRRVKLRPVYPRIPSGCRNICLTSLAGMLHNQGYSPAQIFDELCYANVVACDPSLHKDELDTIVRSVTRYKR